MNNKLKNIRSYDENPTLKDLGGFIEMRHGVVEGDMIRVGSTDDGMELIEKSPGKEFSYLQDVRKFIKSYELDDDLLLGLSTHGRDMYVFIRHRVRQNIGKDIVLVRLAEFLSFTNRKSKVSFYKALKEVLEVGLIYRKAGSEIEFFLNLNIFYNGDSAALYERKTGKLKEYKKGRYSASKFKDI